MPTEEERKRKEYRNGYDPRGPLPGKWDAARAEMNSLRGGPSEFGSAETVGRGVNAVKGYMGSIPEILYEEGERYLNKVRDKTMGPAARERRLQMANYPSEASRSPNMPQAAPEMPVESEAQRLRYYRQPEPADVVNGSDVPMRESSRSSSSASVGTAGAGRGGVGPTISAGDQEYLNRQPVTADPRKRYFDMAQMSLEQREQYLNSLPEGQRPIQTIRGNKEGWYSPGMSKEFATIPEAMSGVEGRPTLKSEMGREEEARDRAAMVDMAGARNRTQVQLKAMGEASENARHAAGKKSDREKWESVVTKSTDEQGNPVEKTWMVNPYRPQERIEMAPNGAPALAGLIAKGHGDENHHRRVDEMMKIMDTPTFLETMKASPPEVRAFYEDRIKKGRAAEQEAAKKKAKGN